MAFLGRSSTGPVATEDVNNDGRVDHKDDKIEAASTRTDVGRAKVDERLSARRQLAERTAAAENVAAGNQVVAAPAGPRPRASVVATLSLVAGVGAALTVLTGILAGPGVALGLVAAFLGIGGLAATTRRHVAGKSDALLGLALGVGAVVVGVLALTGSLPWLTDNSNQVMHVHDWLAARLPWLFPSS